MAKKKSEKFNIKKFLHKSFIPSKKNSYRPHAFRHLMLSVYSLGLILSQLSFGAVQYTPTTPNPEQLKKDIFTHINEQRKKQSENTFTESPLLDRAAQEKLQDMFAKNYWDHTSPTGEKAWVFIDKTGYSYTVAGENLARGFVSADGMVGAWMDSPTHKKNILDKDFSETGIAVGNGVINGKSATVAVQLFGKPSQAFAQGQSLVAGERSVSPKFSLENPVSAPKLPFFAIYLAIFALIIFDGAMIRFNKTHKNKHHMLSFRTSLGLNILVLAVLCLNFTYIS
ncbi:MAG: CAP domain-containing protein [bacterium]|nr:CAP domain-containing protein [bacterium]